VSKSPELRKTIESFVIAAIDLVNNDPDDRCQPGDWIDTPGLLFIFSHDKLKKLPEYRMCRKTLKEDPVIASQLDVLVGIHVSRSRSPKIEQLMVRLPNFGIYENEIKFNHEHFEREYSNFERAFYDDSFNYEVIAPLYGPVFKAPVKINDVLEICRVSRNDFIPSMKNTADRDLLANDFLWAVRACYKLPKIVGDDIKSSLEQSNNNDKMRLRANQTIEQILICLRLLGVSNVQLLALVHRTESNLFRDVRPFPVKYFSALQYQQELPADFNRTFVQFWNSFQQEAVNKHKFIDLAAKRFSYAHERYDWEDRVIDLLIAAEATFLSQPESQNKIGKQISISKRLKFRAAALLGSDSKTREQIKADISSAYTLRSCIVHGNKKELEKVIIKIEKCEHLGLGEEYKLRQFTYRIQEYMRAAICKMIALSSVNKNKKEVVDWNSL